MTTRPSIAGAATASTTTWWRDGTIALAVAAVVFALQLPFRALGVSLLDEGAVLQIAADITRGKVPYLDAFHYVFPAVFYLTAGAFAVGGTSVETARALACAIFACTTAIAYLVARWFAGRAVALAIVGVFLVYRIWAYPQWQLIHYSPLAVALLLLATWLVGEALIGRGTLVLAGITSGLAVLAKQDSGGVGTIALGVAILLLHRPMVRAAVAFGAGWLAVVGGAIALLAVAGAGPAFVEQAIVRPLSSNFSFDYPAWPALWPLWSQDPHLRASPFSYAPPILAELYLPAVLGSRLYRDTPLIDASLKLVFNLPWMLCMIGAAVVAGAAARGRFGEPAVRRLALLVMVSAGSVVAFNPPHDWPHCLVLYPPTLLLLFALAAPTLRRRGARLAGALALACAVAVSGGFAVGLRRHLDAPVRTPAGTLWATAAQSSSLQPLLDAVARLPPDAPLLALPYHPLVNFLAARPSPTRYTVLWPADPPEERDAEVVRRLDETPSTIVVYSLTQAPFLPRMGAFAPTLFAHLVDHYAIAEVFGGDARGYGFLLLAPRPAPARTGTSLLGSMLAKAHVTAEGGAAPVRDAPALAEESRWPFLPVLRVTTLPDAAVAVAYPLVPEPGQQLETSYGINPERWIDVPAPRARFAIAIREAHAEQEVWSAEVAPMTNARDRRWATVAVDLTPWAGRPVDVVLRVRGASGAPVRADSAGWGEPRLAGGRSSS